MRLKSVYLLTLLSFSLLAQGGQEEPGKATYEQFCIVCHRDGLAGAPKFGDKEDWKVRLSGKTVDDLLGVVNKGLNAMPEKGTCTECTDDDLKAAIQYMLPKP